MAEPEGAGKKSPGKKVKVLSILPEERDQALEKSISPVDYVLVSQANRAGGNISLDELKDQNVAQVLGKHGLDWEELAKQAQDRFKSERGQKKDLQRKDARGQDSPDLPSDSSPAQSGKEKGNKPGQEKKDLKGKDRNQRGVLPLPGKFLPEREDDQREEAGNPPQKVKENNPEDITDSSPSREEEGVKESEGKPGRKRNGGPKDNH
jgi:hypothetical protein